LGRPTFNGYAINIEAKTGKSLDEFWKLAVGKGFVDGDKVVAKYSDMLKWLKSDMGLGHVHAGFIIMYLRLRAGDSRVSPSMKEWARSTGYKRNAR